MIKDRLLKEAETNVALQVLENVESAETLEIRGRGVLHLGILLETLRREGFEFAVSPPAALMKRHPVSNAIYEPIEEVTIIVPTDYIGMVTEKLLKRKAVMLSYEEDEGKVKVVMEVPARGLIGYVSGEFKNDVHGQGSVYIILAAAILCWRRADSTSCFVLGQNAQPHLQGVRAVPRGDRHLA